MKFQKGHTINNGRTPWMKGKKHKPESIAKLRAVLKGRKPPKTAFKKGQTAGDKHWNWKGGITPKNQQLRDCDEYRKWRMAVYVRDHFTCQACGQVGYKLEAHHIQPFAKFPALRYEITNGVTLCVECHKLTRKPL